MSRIVELSFDKITGRYSYNFNGKVGTTKSPDLVIGNYRRAFNEGHNRTMLDLMSQAARYAQTNNQVGEINEAGQNEKPPVLDVNERFDINKRFQFLENLCTLVVKAKCEEGRPNSGIVTGEGGLGKTYNVIRSLKRLGLRDVSNVINELPIGATISDRINTFVHIKGHATPKALFRSLYENNGSIVVFDDCDEVLKDPKAIDILKSALDTYEYRNISWLSEIQGSDLPKSFEFTGKVIFISNRQQKDIPQPLRTRAYKVDLVMSTDQKIKRMEHIIDDPEFLPTTPYQYKVDALNAIKTFKERVESNLSLRALMMVVNIRESDPTNPNWIELAEYMLSSSCD